MRLIDGDALIEKFNEKVDMAECLIDARTAERFATFCALADAVEEMPTVDAVPVVRCKDCMHYLIVDEFEGGKRYMCKVNHFSYINSDGDMHYCSYGERKEDKAEGKVKILQSCHMRLGLKMR